MSSSAGCSYINKQQNHWWGYSDKEYHREKVKIYKTYMYKGKHTFDIELLPRYSGTFTMNAIQAELMYFPTEKGNNE